MNVFFERPILNSPYEYPMQHWELDRQGQPTEKIVDKRRPAEFITPTLSQESNQLKPNNNNSYLMKV